MNLKGNRGRIGVMVYWSDGRRYFKLLSAEMERVFLLNTQPLTHSTTRPLNKVCFV